MSHKTVTNLSPPSHYCLAKIIVIYYNVDYEKDVHLIFMNHIETIELKMEETIETLEKRLTTVRAGRANPSMLNGIMVNYYGSATPINSVANITVPEARQILIKPFDKSSLKDIEKAIQEANLGINPTNNGEMIILTLPELTEERRREYVKQAKTMGEEAKIALRNIRQDGNNDIKKEELPEDEEKRILGEVQELISKYNKIVEDKIKEKSDELMEV